MHKSTYSLFIQRISWAISRPSSRKKLANRKQIYHLFTGSNQFCRNISKWFEMLKNFLQVVSYKQENVRQNWKIFKCICHSEPNRGMKMKITDFDENWCD